MTSGIDLEQDMIQQVKELFQYWRKCDYKNQIEKAKEIQRCMDIAIVAGQEELPLVESEWTGEIVGGRKVWTVK